MDTNSMIEAVVTSQPNLTEIQSQKVAEFFNGSSMKLVEDAPLYKSVIGTVTGWILDRFRVWDYKNPLEASGIITTGVKTANKTPYRVYLPETDLEPMDPHWLTNKITGQKGDIHAGKPLVPLRDVPKFTSRYSMANLSYMNFVTLYDSIYFSNILEGPMAVINAIVQNLYKKYTKYEYALEANLIANSYSDELLDTQKIDVDLGSTDYLNITGQGALDFAQALANLITHLEVEGTKKFNEAKFQSYMKSSDIKVYCRLGLKSAISKALMANNYFTTDYVNTLLGHLVEIACPLTPCNYVLKGTSTKLYPVYAETSSESYVGNGIALGLSTTEGQTGSASVEYTFDSEDVEYKESHPEVFGAIIEPGRLNKYISEFGALQSEVTIRDSFAKASDLIIQSFGVNTDGQNIGGSIFQDQTFAAIYFQNSAE